MTEKLYIRGMEVNMPENHEGYFFGQHSTGYGNVWDAVLGNAERLSIYIAKCVQQGDIVFQETLEGKKFSGLIYPKQNLINAFSLIETVDKRNHLASIYPILTGINNNLKLKETYPWSIEGEGEVAAETDLGKIINFHNPYLAIDNKNFKFNKIQTVSLAGLALSINKMEVQEFPAEGDTYKHYLEEFLKENPHKTERDFEAPIHRVDAEHFRMFVPSDYCSEFEIATQIEEIRYVDFLDEKITVMKVNLEHSDDDEYLYCNIYASKYVLKNYKPQVGDGISAVIWMTGFFN